jgi:hypothetical protein
MARDDEEAATQESVCIDLVTEDLVSNEFVLYLVEDGPWPPAATDEWPVELKRIQDRVLSAVDCAVGGGLIGPFPDSHGRPVRIQIDSPNGCPSELADLIDKLSEFLIDDPTFADAIRQSIFINGLRLVTGHQLGRFKTRSPVV